MYASRATIRARIAVRAKVSRRDGRGNKGLIGIATRHGICVPVNGRARCRASVVVNSALGARSELPVRVTYRRTAQQARHTRVHARADGDFGSAPQGDDDAEADGMESIDGSEPQIPQLSSAGDLETVADVIALIKTEVFSSSFSSRKDSKKPSSSTRTYLIALAALVAIHLRDPGWGTWNYVRVAGSLLLGGGLALKGYRSGSLSLPGAVGATCVGWGTLYSGVRFGTALGVFFFASSAMTKVGTAVKRQIDEHFVEGKESGARGFGQVLANGGVPTFLAMGYCFATGGPEHLLGVLNAFETPLAAAFIGYYACCAGDTWASELGVLSKQSPRMITNPSCVVKPGTNGGVTFLGFVASGAGGLAVGLAFWLGGVLVPLATGQFELASRFLGQWPVLAIGLGAGFVGSLIDSCLGATIQFSGYCCEKRRMVSKPGPSVTKVSGINVLSNSAVNFVSAAICAAALYFGAIAMGLPRA